MTEREDEPYFEDEDIELMNRLGVRPTAYKADDSKISHPDQRPCPPWCWTDGSDYGHAINYGHPMVADHKLEPSPITVASLYQGDPCTGGSVPWQATAVIETHLQQQGMGSPRVRLLLRHWQGRDHISRTALRLSLADARDLVTSLQYVLGVADGTTVQVKRHDHD